MVACLFWKETHLMNTRRAVATWGLLFALALMIGAGTAMASHRWGCWKYANGSINFYNGASGSYWSYYEQEAQTDSNSWHNYTDVSLTDSGSGTTDHLNAYSGFYGANGWLGLASIQRYSGCTVLQGNAYLNRSYLDSGYSSTNIKHVACQEVAHLFGLGHNRGSSTTCMNDTILTAPQPNTHDRDLVNSIY
jgi:hypothetical protein